MNCLGKISERILAQRLGYLAETIELLYPTQIERRQRKSAIDTALLLTDYIKKARLKKHIATALFLDIKGTFDYIAKLRLPPSLIS